MNGGNGSILFQSHAWRQVHTPVRRLRTPVWNAHPRIEQIPSAATETKTKPRTTIGMHLKPGTKSRRRLEARLSKEHEVEILQLAIGGHGENAGVAMDYGFANGCNGGATVNTGRIGYQGIEPDYGSD